MLKVSLLIYTAVYIGITSFQCPVSKAGENDPNQVPSTPNQINNPNTNNNLNTQLFGNNSALYGAPSSGSTNCTGSFCANIGVRMNSQSGSEAIIGVTYQFPSDTEKATIEANKKSAAYQQSKSELDTIIDLKIKIADALRQGNEPLAISLAMSLAPLIKMDYKEYLRTITKPQNINTGIIQNTEIAKIPNVELSNPPKTELQKPRKKVCLFACK
jgi:hypothetical protein